MCCYGFTVFVILDDKYAVENEAIARHRHHQYFIGCSKTLLKHHAWTKMFSMYK
jgi:hypothetical protein